MIPEMLGDSLFEDDAPVEVFEEINILWRDTCFRIPFRKYVCAYTELLREAKWIGK